MPEAKKSSSVNIKENSQAKPFTMPMLFFASTLMHHPELVFSGIG
jgi:hypothetical protein